ncbi:MAG TPA: ketose-bisphosphate aldolase, partial [Spirochaetia bacterium]|nr:ketose-bisphosphate aldolase [Spirochaetia bacterium]
GRYALPAFNFVCLEQMLAIRDACVETASPFILQCSAHVRASIGPAMVVRMAQGCIEGMRGLGRMVPMALHLDHGMTEADCKACIDDGFSSVMIDGSVLAFDENADLTARVVRYAHERDVTVEGELGTVGGAEDAALQAESRYTDPARVAEFVRRTGVDSLAVSIGTSHGVVKIKAKEGEPLPSLRFDILEAIEKDLPGFPIVLHGASALPPRYVAMLNQYGGRLTEAQGIPEAQTARAARSAVRKVNVASDGWIAMSAAVRKALAENPASIDPRVFLSKARQEMKDVYVRKIVDVLGSAGKAPGGPAA